MFDNLENLSKFLNKKRFQLELFRYKFDEENTKGEKNGFKCLGIIIQIMMLILYLQIKY